MKKLIDILALHERADLPESLARAQTLLNGDVKDYAKELLSSPEYRLSLAVRLQGGTLHPSIESKLWDHAYGKPKERIEIENKVDSSTLSIEEILERSERVKEIARALIKREQAQAAFRGVVDGIEDVH